MGHYKGKTDAFVHGLAICTGISSMGHGHMLTRQMLTRQMLTGQMLTGQMLTPLAIFATIAHKLFV